MNWKDKNYYKQKAIEVLAAIGICMGGGLLFTLMIIIHNWEYLYG